MDIPTEEYKENLNKEFLKNKRNQLLLNSDKYLLSDYPITPDNLILIKEYRQQLRDFTKNNYILPNIPQFL